MPQTFWVRTDPNNGLKALCILPCYSPRSELGFCNVDKGKGNVVASWEGAIHVSALIPGPNRAAQPKTSAPRILRKYIARLPPSSNHSSISSQLKSQPCISGEYIGLNFLVTGAAEVFGVAPVLEPSARTFKSYVNMCVLVPHITNYVGMHAYNGHFQLYILPPLKCVKSIQRTREKKRKKGRFRCLSLIIYQVTANPKLESRSPSSFQNKKLNLEK